MRERIFKAKRKNWKELPKEKWWVKGAIFEDNENSYIITSLTVTEWEDNTEAAADVIAYLVDPDTICESTGMTDRDNNMIFEGDIVHDIESSFNPLVEGVVKFKIGTFSSGIHQYTGWVIENKNKKTENSPLYQYGTGDFGEKIGFLVIGNIFDNPELMQS